MNKCRQVLPGARCRLPRLAPAFKGKLGALVHLLLYCDQSVHKRSLQPLALFRSEAVSFLSRTDRPLSQRSSELSQPHRPAATAGATTKHRKENDDAELDENEKDALDALCDAIFGHEDGTESIDAAALALQFADEPIMENVLTEDLLWRTTMDALAFGHP